MGSHKSFHNCAAGETFPVCVLQIVCVCVCPALMLMQFYSYFQWNLGLNFDWAVLDHGFALTVALAVRSGLTRKASTWLFLALAFPKRQVSTGRVLTFVKLMFVISCFRVGTANCLASPAHPTCCWFKPPSENSWIYSEVRWRTSGLSSLLRQLLKAVGCIGIYLPESKWKELKMQVDVALLWFVKDMKIMSGFPAVSQFSSTLCWSVNGIFPVKYSEVCGEENVCENWKYIYRASANCKKKSSYVSSMGKKGSNFRLC